MKRIALSLDGVLIDYDNFIIIHGTKYYKDLYGINIINYNGSDVDELFDLKDYYQNRYINLSEEEIENMVNKSKQDFWRKHLVKYYFNTSFREEASETINKLLDEDYQITVVVDRKFIGNENLLGSLMRKIVKQQFKKNGIKPEKLNFIWASEMDNITDFAYRNYFDIICDYNPERLLVNSSTDTVIIKTSYNLDKDIGNAVRFSNFTDNEFYNVVKSIENKNKLLKDNYCYSKKLK